MVQLVFQPPSACIPSIDDRERTNAADSAITRHNHTMASMETVLAALQTLYTDPKPEAKQQANAWLENFQKEVRSVEDVGYSSKAKELWHMYPLPYLQPEAWETANVILSSPEAPPEPKLFAAQTFRAKVSRYFIDVNSGQQDMQPPQVSGIP